MPPDPQPAATEPLPRTRGGMRPVLLTLASTLAVSLAVWQHSRMEVERHLRVEFEA